MNQTRPKLPLIVVNANKHCANKHFQTFLGVTTAAGAKAHLCEKLGIESKKELATNLRACNQFGLIMQRYNKWLTIKNI